MEGVILVDALLIALGAAVVLTADAFRVRRHPGDRIGWGWGTQVKRDRQEIWATAPGALLVAAGAAGLDRHIGWWGYLIGVGALLVSASIPVLVHDSGLKQRTGV